MTDQTESTQHFVVFVPGYMGTNWPARNRPAGVIISAACRGIIQLKDAVEDLFTTTMYQTMTWFSRDRQDVCSCRRYLSRSSMGACWML
jgi:hypothetical protein